MTRLNQKWSYRNLDLDYMHYRLDLFELTTYPSLLNQSFKDFKGLIITSPTIPDEIRKRMESYENYIIVYLDKKDGSQLPGNEFIEIFKKNYVREEPGLLITTNIDSDDLLQKDYLQVINSNLEKIKEYPCVFHNRIYSQIDINGKYLMEINFDPSVYTFIEKSDDISKIKTCWCRGHKMIVENAKENKYINDLKFLMTVHAANLSTSTVRTRIKKRDHSIDLKKDYGVNEKSLVNFLRKPIPPEFVEREKEVRRIRKLGFK